MIKQLNWNWCNVQKLRRNKQRHHSYNGHSVLPFSRCQSRVSDAFNYFIIHIRLKLLHIIFTIWCQWFKCIYQANCMQWPRIKHSIITIGDSSTSIYCCGFYASARLRFRCVWQWLNNTRTKNIASESAPDNGNSIQFARLHVCKIS